MAAFEPIRRSGLRLVCLLLALLLPAQPGAQAQKRAATDVRVGIVLGNAPAATDEPTPMQTARCLKTLELYKSGAVNTLLVTGRDRR